MILISDPFGRLSTWDEGPLPGEDRLDPSLDPNPGPIADRWEILRTITPNKINGLGGRGAAQFGLANCRLQPLGHPSTDERGRHGACQSGSSHRVPVNQFARL